MLWQMTFERLYFYLTEHRDEQWRDYGVLSTQCAYPIAPSCCNTSQSHAGPLRRNALPWVVQLTLQKFLLTCELRLLQLLLPPRNYGCRPEADQRHGCVEAIQALTGHPTLVLRISGDIPDGQVPPRAMCENSDRPS